MITTKATKPPLIKQMLENVSNSVTSLIEGKPFLIITNVKSFLICFSVSICMFLKKKKKDYHKKSSLVNV